MVASEEEEEEEEEEEVSEAFDHNNISLKGRQTSRHLQQARCNLCSQSQTWARGLAGVFSSPKAVE